VGVFDPGWATWYLKNSNTVGAPDIAPFAYGARGWAPLALRSELSHSPVGVAPAPGGPEGAQIQLQLPATAAGNGFTASVAVADASPVASVALDVDLNHDGRFDGPGETGYATGTLDGPAGQVTVRGLVAGSYQVQAH